MVRCTFSPARAWRPAVGARLARTLALTITSAYDQTFLEIESHRSGVLCRNSLRFEPRTSGITAGRRRTRPRRRLIATCHATPCVVARASRRHRSDRSLPLQVIVLDRADRNGGVSCPTARSATRRIALSASLRSFIRCALSYRLPSFTSDRVGKCIRLHRRLTGCSSRTRSSRLPLRGACCVPDSANVNCHPSSIWRASVCGRVNLLNCPAENAYVQFAY